MSQIETLMLIILGLAGFALAVLLLGRLFWGQAVNLGKRRSRREDPATIAELRAEKDKLRAEYAMLSRKLELRLNDLKTRLAEQTAEVSRNRNRVGLLINEIKARDKEISRLETETEKLKSQMAPLEDELATRTQTAQQLREQLRERDAEISNLTARLDSARLELAHAVQATPAASPDTKIRPLADMPADASEVQTRLEKRIADLTSLSTQIENQRRQLTRQHSELRDLYDGLTHKPEKPDGEKAPQKKKKKAAKTKAKKTKSASPARKLEKQLKDAERETDALQKQLTKLDREWDEKLKELEQAKSGATKIVLSEKQPDAEKESGGDESADDITNVITLANRIRSLQKDIKS